MNLTRRKRRKWG